MHFIKVKRPRYEQSRRYKGMVGEVVGHWGPDSNSDSRAGYLVEFEGGAIVGLSEDEVEVVDIEKGGPSI